MTAVVGTAGSLALAVAAQVPEPRERSVRVSPSETLRTFSIGLTKDQEDAYLRRLGLTGDLNLDIDPKEALERSYGVDEGEIRTPWGNIEWGLGWIRKDLFGKSMTIESFETKDGIRFVDDWGGELRLTHRRFPRAMCDTKRPCVSAALDRAEDQVGPVAEIRRDENGYMMGALYGEVLGIRYHYSADDLERLAEGLQRSSPEWFEVIDNRTGDQVLDSRLVGEVPKHPYFQLTTHSGSLARAEFGEGLHVPVGGAVRARIPLDGGDLWRSLSTYENSLIVAFGTRVDYSSTHVRFHFLDGLVVQAPRSGSSAEPITLVHPDLELPLVDPKGPRKRTLPPPTPSVKRFPIDRRHAIPGSESQAPMAIAVSALAGGPPEITVCETKQVPGGESMTCTAPKPGPIPGVDTPIEGTDRLPGSGMPDRGDGTGSGHSPPVGTSGAGGGAAQGDNTGLSTPEKTGQLRDAKTEALRRAETDTCRAIFNNHLSSIQDVEFKPGWLDSVDGPYTEPEPERCYDQGNSAYTFVSTNGDAIIEGPNFVVYLCEAFYNRDLDQMSTTVLHEWAHLAGRRHETFGGVDADDSAGMSRMIDSLC